MEVSTQVNLGFFDFFALTSFWWAFYIVDPWPAKSRDMFPVSRPRTFEREWPFFNEIDSLFRHYTFADGEDEFMSKRAVIVALRYRDAK